MYTVNYFYFYSTAPFVPSFQGVKRLVCCIYICPNHTIMYLSDLGGTTTHELLQYFSPGNFNSQNISNVLFALSDGG